MSLALTGAELATITTMWSGQKRELVAAFAGRSMVPTIAPGQRVLVRFGADVAIGDVAAYRLAQQLVVHRVVARSEKDGWFLTWGDGNSLPDAAVSRDQIVGVIAGVEADGAFHEPPPAPRSLGRTALLRLIVRSDAATAEQITARVRFLIRLRANANPIVLSRKVANRIARSVRLR